MLIRDKTIVKGVCSVGNSKFKSQNLKMLFNRFNEFNTFKGLRFKSLRCLPAGRQGLMVMIK